MFAEELSKAFGYLSSGEVFILKKAINFIPDNGVIVNIGAGPGTSGLSFYEMKPTAKRYTVDIQEHHPEGGLQNERNAFTNAGIIDKLPVQILGDSKAVGKSWNRGQIDFLFIDGDHSVAGATGDFENWLPHVKKGGIVAVHDYCWKTWPDVFRVTNRFMFGKYLMLGLVDTLIFFEMVPHGV